MANSGYDTRFKNHRSAQENREISEFLEAHIPRYFKKVEKRRQQAREKAAEEVERQAMKDDVEAFRKKKELAQ